MPEKREGKRSPALGMEGGASNDGGKTLEKPLAQKFVTGRQGAELDATDTTVDHHPVAGPQESDSHAGEGAMVVDLKAVAFESVLDDELKQIDARRKHRHLASPPAERYRADGPGGGAGATPSLKGVQDESRERRLVGLAFSGGGIRSATFNLGLLQGLAGLELLKYVDYLSTVSGGGYIGGWLAAWIKRAGVEAVEQQLRPNDGASADPNAEPAPIVHLRRHTNYLAPRQGFLSADGWVLWATYLRNTLLNQLVLLPATVAVLLLSRLVMFIYYPTGVLYSSEGERPLLSSESFLAILTAVAVFVGLAFWNALRAAALVRPKEKGEEGEGRPWHSGWLLAGVVAPLVIAALVFCTLAPYRLPISEWVRAQHREGVEQVPSLPWLVEMAVFMSATAFLSAVSYAVMFLRSRADVHAAAWCFVGGLVGGSLLYGLDCFLFWLYSWDGTVPLLYVKAAATAHVTTFGPPLFLLAITGGLFLGVGLMKGQLREELREWWSSVCARLLIVGTVWMSINLIALYGAALVLWAGPWVKASLASGWLFAVASGVLAGGGARTGATRRRFSVFDVIARFGFHVFIAGLLILVALSVHALLDNPPLWEYADESVWPRRQEPARPPIEVTLDRTVSEGRVTYRTENRLKYQKVLNELAAIRQRYWIGMLNTTQDWVPSVNMSLTAESVPFLVRSGVPKDVVDKLAPLLDEPGLTPSAFEDRLDELLPNPADESFKVRIEQAARFDDQQTLDPNAWKLLGKLGGWLLACLAVLALAAWRVDVNLLSLHALYGNRLCRAYLGASRVRHPDPVTGLDANDDLALADVRPTAADGYAGPYLLVNTALNLVHTKELAWQERKAESFVMTPLSCGSETTGYRATAGGAGGVAAFAGGVSVGTATTISGAAASPNMGYHSSPAVTMLLTVFNARLGAWLGNPGNPDSWMNTGPELGFLQLFQELFGLTDSAGRYIYLSDGGHFENLGVYELVRRRCQYVIVSDAGQDGDHTFEDLGNLIRKVRIDFGIRIEIDTGLVRLLGDQRRCRWHCAIGRIRYDDVDENALPGTLVYIKPSLTGDEPADVLQYAASHPTFPHESTGNQFYTESQFESYRALGQHVAEAVFTQSVADMEKEEPNPFAARPRCRELFSSLVRRWFALPPNYEASFIESTHGYIDVQQAYRTDKRLWRLTLDLYPELNPDNDVLRLVQAETREQQAERRCAELHVVAQMLRVMENAWLSLNLDVNYAHPLNRGWMDVFHRWTSAETVRGYWPILRAELGRDFVSFCEKQMRLGVVQGQAVPLRQDEPEWRLARLLLEFEDQWPGKQTTWLKECITQAQLQGGPLAWLIRPDNPYPAAKSAAALKNDELPAGIILVMPDVDADFQALDPKEYSLFVWLRGAYRNTGLGRPAVRAVLEELPNLLGLPFWLRVHLPTGDLRGPGGKLQKAMWLTFFHHHEFVRLSEGIPGSRSREADVTLLRKFS